MPIVDAQHAAHWPSRWIAAGAAFLAFEGELMAGKRLLPDFGGAAYVWCSVVLFFQLLVVVGYYGSRWLERTRCRPFIVVALALSGCLTLAPLPRAGWPLPLELQPLFALLPYAGLTAALFCVTPLLHRREVDLNDFTIYAWSNAGALAGLICYPFLVEPNIDLSTQNRIWVIGGICLCAFGPGNFRAVAARARTSSEKGPIRWQWWVLPAVSSATLLATTNLISYETAAGPLAWAFPLALFLGTCVWAFSGDRTGSVGILAVAGLAAVTGMHMLLTARDPRMVIFALVAGGTSMLACHVWLATSRTSNTYGFYAALGIGGAMGSAVMVLVVPRVTKSPVEFPVLTLSVLCIAGFLWSGRFVKPLLVTCAVVAVGGTVVAEFSGRADEVTRMRTLYGCWVVTKSPTNEIYTLINNRTTHGQEDRKHPRAHMTYYATNSGFGQLMLEKQKSADALRLGVVGLGAGTINSYLRPQDSIIYYELDPAAEQLARAWFTYLDNPRCRVVIGDGRKSLEHDTNQFDVLVLDAFNGDAIPMHLLTREAGFIYRKRLKPGGALAIHITNSHVDLLPVARALAADLSMGCELYDNNAIRWAILRRGGRMTAGPVRDWTDERSSLLGLFRNRETLNWRRTPPAAKIQPWQ